ncbi:multidrug resistance protein [Escherichia coli]|nr:multidrug resistance protein [Escherichia coli]
MPRFFTRHAATLFFPMALILYDFAAYLSTDLIQPGIINVVRDFNADVSLALLPSVSILLAVWRYSGCWGRFPTELAAGRC